MSAATAAFAAILAYPGAAADIRLFAFPSCFIGAVAASLVMMRWGKELDVDPEFLKRMKDPEFAAAIDQLSHPPIPDAAATKKAMRAVIIFAVTILLIVLVAHSPDHS
jgi:anaerobic C4-dicarboxylate transporter